MGIQQGITIDAATPRWAMPFLTPARYKGAKGGRGSGKSFFFAEQMILDCIEDPELPCVCIREVQKSLKFSAKRLLEDRIRFFQADDLFDVTQTEIRRKGGNGIIIFQGMQDHTSDSIKSLQGFKRAWVEEAQNLSHRSLKLLRPTIREDGSELWFSWNPDQPDDAVDTFFKNPPDGSVLVHVNYDQNPFLPQVLRDEMLFDRKNDPDGFAHVWEGGYNNRSHAQIFAGKWVVDEFDVDETYGDPLFGADWGFSQDPTTLVRMFIRDNVLYIDYEFYQIGLEIVDIPAAFKTIPLAESSVIRADNARPETISHVRKNGGLKIMAADKWPGSVEDGIEFMRGFNKIVIHPRCPKTAQECRLYSYKIDQRTGDVLTKIVDKENHIIDAIRYGLQPLIKRSGVGGVIGL